MRRKDKMTTIEAQEKYKKMLIQNNIPEAELARYLHIIPQTLNYLLNHAAKMDVTIYQEIKLFFKTKGISSAKKDERLLMQNKQVLETTAFMMHGLTLFNKILEDRLEDNPITDSEKVDLLSQLETMKSEVTEKIQEIKNYIVQAK